MKSLLFAALLLLSYNVFSQVSKGAILVGGSLNVNYSKSEDDEKPGPSWAWYKQSSFTTRISPSIGFFTSDTWMTGFGLTYDYNSTSSENGIPLGNGGWVKNSSKTKSHFYSANAFVRKYINLKEKLFLTMNFSVEGGMGISKQELESFDAGGDLKTNSYYTSLVVTPGLTYFISNKWAVTSTIGILQTTFQWRKSDDDNSAPDNFSANTNLSVRANTFSVGLQYFLRNGAE